MIDVSKPQTDWENCYRLLHKYCRSALAYAKARGLHDVEYDDLFQEASLAYLRALSFFDPSRNFKFTTYMGSVVYQRLSVVLRQSGDKNRVIGNISLDVEPAEDEASLHERLKSEDMTPEEQVRGVQELERYLGMLSPMARLAVELTLDPPDEVAEECVAWQVKNNLKATRQLSRCYVGTTISFSFVIQRILPIRFGPISRGKTSQLMDEIRRAQSRL